MNFEEYKKCKSKQILKVRSNLELMGLFQLFIEEFKANFLEAANKEYD